MCFVKTLFEDSCNIIQLLLLFDFPRKVDKKAMIVNRYNSTSFPIHHTGNEHKQLRRHKVKQHKQKSKRSALSQQIFTRLSYTTNSQRLTGSGRTMTIKINHNRSTALERSVINNWRWGLKPVLHSLDSVVVHEHMSRIVTKPTKWHVRPAKTQISLGIRPVWSVFAVRLMGS